MSPYLSASSPFPSVPGHKNGDVAMHYSAPELQVLIIVDTLRPGRPSHLIRTERH